MPDIFFPSLTDVPEGLREVAVTDGDKVKVNVVAKTKLDEFRENNVKLAQERDDTVKLLARAKTLLGTEDFEAAEKELGEIRSVAQRVKDGELVENKGLEEAVTERTKEMRAGFEGEIQSKAQEARAWKEKAEKSATMLRKSYIDRAITDAVVDPESGVDHKALPDILNRAYTIFQASDEGKLTPLHGEAVMYGADGSTPMSPKEWVATKLKEEAPYFFKASRGGGAGGTNDVKALGNMTQAEIDKLSPYQKMELANKEAAKVRH